MKNLLLFIVLIFSPLSAQKIFTKSDTLLGSNTQFRSFWNISHYGIKLKADFETKSLKGSNKISFVIEEDVVNPVMQIDLQEPMKFSDIAADFPIASSKKTGHFIFVETKKAFKKGEKHFIEIYFEGKPVQARNAPWDGGWVFTTDSNGNPWMSAATEGIGQSVWLPVKEYWGDEPENGMSFEMTVPKGLTAIANGKLVARNTANDSETFLWEVKNPINSYNIIPYIGKYVNFKDVFQGEKGQLDLDYWVLEPNLEAAEKQFAQVKPMLQSFEHWFGPYPFYEDGFKMVESPYLGMEHQSNIAYGNGFQNGYMGRDLSGTGIGLSWDFIIVHESGHEWFGNNITAKDKADMWIHESFTNYSEALFVENTQSRENGFKYAVGLRQNIQNDRPVIGHYGVRNTGSGDMYYKGANMLHTIRQVINNDAEWRRILRGLNTEFRHQTVTTRQIENYINLASGMDFTTVFNQYLRTTQIPVLEYAQYKNVLKFRYKNVVEGFRLPVRINNGLRVLHPTTQWQSLTLETSEPVVFDVNYYVEYKKAE